VNESLNDAVYRSVPHSPVNLVHAVERAKRTDGKQKAARPASISIPPASSFLLASGCNSSLPTAVPSNLHDNNKHEKAPSASHASHRRARSMTVSAPGSGVAGVSSVFVVLAD
jgi:hypothetical protein